MPRRWEGLRTPAFTGAALVGFAANSLLCRAALGDGLIDPVSFTAVRLATGALSLVLVSRIGSGAAALPLGSERAGSWTGAFWLFAYAIAFSLAYVHLTTGTGALLLFGAVQLTMIASALAAGERPRAIEWIGFLAAVAGLVVLVAPGVAAPDPLAAAMMAGAGVAWGAYSLRGRRATHPLRATSGNFVRSVPLIAAAAGIAWVVAGGGAAHLSGAGLALAVASGALASGMGYALWYAVLPALTTTRAAMLQLSVPILAALGGALLLAEPPTLRLGLASLLVVGGLALAIQARAAPPAPSRNAS